MAEPAEDPNVAQDLVPGSYVRIREHALDAREGNRPFGQVGDSLPVGGLLVAQAGSGMGVFAPHDLVGISAADIPDHVLADIHRRSGMGRAEEQPPLNGASDH